MPPPYITVLSTHPIINYNIDELWLSHNLCDISDAIVKGSDQLHFYYY